MIRTLGCLPALIRPPFRCSTVPLQGRARNGTTTATLRVIYPATNPGPGRATQHRLKAEERDELTRLVKTGPEAAYRRRNAQILLLADQGEHGPGQRDTEIGEQVGVTPQTVEKVRKRCVQECVQQRLARSAGEQTRRGKSQSPVAWMAGRRETDDLKPIDTATVKGGRRVTGP